MYIDRYTSIPPSELTIGHDSIAVRIDTEIEREGERERERETERESARARERATAREKEMYI
jgi:hypothetical protein